MESSSGPWAVWSYRASQNIPIWLTIVIGIVAALIGTAIASALGVASTGGIDWIELIIQIVLAAAGVIAVTGMYGRRGLR